MKTTQLIENWIDNISGECCWGVVAGGCTGTAFILDFGEKIRRKEPLINEELSEDCRIFHSRFSLFVESAQWKLGTDDNGAVKKITDSNDDHSPDGPMVKGLESLVGNVVSSATFDSITHNLDIYFQKNYMRLKVFGKIPKDSRGYNLYTPKHIVKIEEDRQINLTSK